MKYKAGQKLEFIGGGIAVFKIGTIVEVEVVNLVSNRYICVGMDDGVEVIQVCLQKELKELDNGNYSITED